LAVPNVTASPVVEVTASCVEAALPGDTTQNGALVKAFANVIEQAVALVKLTLPATSDEPVVSAKPAQEFAVGVPDV
jgi:hypothetical protein